MPCVALLAASEMVLEAAVAADDAESVPDLAVDLELSMTLSILEEMFNSQSVCGKLTVEEYLAWYGVQFAKIRVAGLHSKEDRHRFLL